MIEQFESSLMQFFGAIAWGKWISTLFLLILGIVLASFAARGVTRFMEDRASRHHTVMLRRLVFYIVLAIFFVAALREAGIEPFANKFTPSENCGDAKAHYEEGRPVTVTDHLVSKREMGKTIFAQIRNLKSESSIAFRKDLNRTTHRYINHINPAEVIDATSKREWGLDPS